MSRHTKLVTLKGSIIRDSDKAICFTIHDISGCPLDPPEEHEWFPLSQVEKIVRAKEPEEDILIVSEWIMKQKELMV